MFFYIIYYCFPVSKPSSSHISQPLSLSFNLNFNLSRNAMPRNVSSIAMAIHTPCSPMVGASSNASVRRTPQMLARLRTLEPNVLPAPTNTL